MEKDEEAELKGIAGAEYLTLVDRLKSHLHAKTDRNDAGQVTFPRREFLENQARMRQREEEELRKKQGG